MIRIQLASDIHLEFAPITLTNKGSDVLILSGDICVATVFNKSEASPYFAQAQKFKAFFHQVSQEWDQVFYVMGNHEHYRGYFDQSADTLRSILPENVTLLDESFVDYKGYRFIGGTLWTDITDPIQEMYVQNGLNDFRIIQIQKENYRKFRVADATRAHRRLLGVIDANLVDNTIVVGHHGPSWNSVTQEFRSNHYSNLNPGYVTALDEWIMDRPQIVAWTHGHVHSSHDYMIGTTRVLCNARGYPLGTNSGKHENPGFEPDRVYVI